MTMLLHEGVALQAQQRPDAAAVFWQGTATTYAELDSSSNRLAQLLVDGGCGRGDRVALFMPKAPAAIVAMLGTLKTGAAYVPLDPADAPARLARALKSADCRWVLAAGPVGHRLHEAFALAAFKQVPLTGWLDKAQQPAEEARAMFTWRDLAAFPDRAPVITSRDTDLAHILFTSGSTGVPKGVMINHRSVAAFLEWATRYFRIESSDRISQHPPLRFDVATFDTFGALWSGAELHLVPPELNLVPHKLAQFIRDERLTQWFSVPSVMNLLAKFDVLRSRDFQSLKRVIFAGEVLPTPTLIYWMRRLPQVRFTNLYGPTETTISSSYHSMESCPSDDRAPIPIGRPCDGEEFVVLDEQLFPTPDGEIGNLYIRGVGLSAGYWQDPAKTREAFVSDPEDSTGSGRIYKTGDLARLGDDGLYYFCGRADNQIKTRGYRIELGEIEAALNTVTQLSESAVVAIGSAGFEGALICCAYALLPGADLPLKALRARLAASLPDYMLPVRWMRYERLPKNPNGKLDRTRLREAFSTIEAERDGNGEPQRDRRHA